MKHYSSALFLKMRNFIRTRKLFLIKIRKFLYNNKKLNFMLRKYDNDNNRKLYLKKVQLYGVYKKNGVLTWSVNFKANMKVRRLYSHSFEIAIFQFGYFIYFIL
jgi:hypothetical protein